MNSRFLRKNIRFYFCVFLLVPLLNNVFVYGQDKELLFNLYFRNDLNALKLELIKFTDKRENDLHFQFYNAIFITDGEEARNVYQYVYDNGDARLKLLSAERLYQYYYAKGYYVNAEKYQKYVAEHELPVTAIKEDVPKPPIEEPRIPVRLPTKPIHFIQVGAFGVEENAAALSKMLMTQNIGSKIVKRHIGEAELFCVWIPGKSNFEETLKYANIIKIKYDLNFRIIKE